MGDITLILQRVSRGEAGAEDELMRRVYAELRQLAAARLSRHASGSTLQPTALVHEAWLRLGGDDQPPWQSRRHFFGAAAQAMRQILVERARRQRAARHGGRSERTTFTESGLVSGPPGEIIAVNEALDQLAALAPEKAELVKLRYFAGLEVAETAAILGISEATAHRWWVFARAWLLRELASPPGRRQRGPGAAL